MTAHLFTAAQLLQKFNLLNFDLYPKPKVICIPNLQNFNSLSLGSRLIFFVISHYQRGGEEYLYMFEKIRTQ